MDKGTIGKVIIDEYENVVNIPTADIFNGSMIIIEIIKQCGKNGYSNNSTCKWYLSDDVIYKKNEYWYIYYKIFVRLVYLYYKLANHKQHLKML